MPILTSVSKTYIAAAAIGDVEQVDAWLDRDPALINRKGGYFKLATAHVRRLCAACRDRPLSRRVCACCNGAQIRTPYYMWGGQYKFTALTGVFGQGEGGPVNQPEHPDCVAFARALLDAGASPNDSQAAYNRCFEPDNTCFELLLEYGLSSGDRNNWLINEDDRLLPQPQPDHAFSI